MKLHTYLNYGGNCRAAFQFYEQHLGGKILALMTQAEQPGPAQVPAERRNDVMYARLALGGAEIMGSDAPPATFQPMRSAYLSLSLDSNAEAERIFALLAEDGQVFMPMAETFFAHRFGVLRDRFGTSWMILRERAPNA